MPRFRLFDGHAFDSDRNIAITFSGVGLVGAVLAGLGGWLAGRFHTSAHALFILMLAFGLVVALVGLAVLIMVVVSYLHQRRTSAHLKRDIERKRSQGARTEAG